MKKKILITVAILSITGMVVVALELLHVTDFYTRNKPDQSQQTPEAINLNPPTDNEKQAGDEQKNKNETDEEQQRNAIDGTDQSASVIITDAGQYDNVIEIRSFVPDHYQDGTCTITLVKGGLTVSKSTPAYRDVSTTICTNPLFERSEFAEAGEWQVTVSYASDSAKGTSGTKLITIK